MGAPGTRAGVTGGAWARAGGAADSADDAGEREGDAGGRRGSGLGRFGRGTRVAASTARFSARAAVSPAAARVADGARRGGHRPRGQQQHGGGQVAPLAHPDRHEAGSGRGRRAGRDSGRGGDVGIGRGTLRNRREGRKDGDTRPAGPWAAGRPRDDRKTWSGSKATSNSAPTSHIHGRKADTRAKALGKSAAEQVTPSDATPTTKGRPAGSYWTSGPPESPFHAEQGATG